MGNEAVNSCCCVNTCGASEALVKSGASNNPPPQPRPAHPGPATPQMIKVQYSWPAMNDGGACAAPLLTMVFAPPGALLDGPEIIDGGAFCVIPCCQVRS